MKKILFPVLLFFASISAAAEMAPRIAEVKVFNGKPTLFVDHQPVSPDFYALTHAYGARWSWEEVPQRNLKNFYDIGFRLFQLDLYLEDIWHEGAPALDLDKARHQVRGLLDVCPDAAVVMRIHVNAPFWWNEANHDECVEFANGPIDQRAYGPPFNNEDGDINRPLRASLASLKWRREAGEKVREFCQRLAASPEGNAVIGMHVSGGVYGEWHNWGFIDNDPDTSQPMTDYFRQWLKQKYSTNTELQKAWHSGRFTLENASVPDLAERDFSGDGDFRDPERERRVIDYFAAQHDVVAEDIEHFTGIVKHTWPRPLIVGVFYGYLHMTFARQAAGGHLAIERILNCPTIDYLAAPQSYWGATQNAGGSGNSRGVIESALLHGKLWLDEMDNGNLQDKTAVDPVRNSGKFDPDYLPVMQRSALYPLMRGIGLWYYDFGPRESFGWWDNPVYLKSIRAEKELFDRRLGQKYEPAADVLYVWDQESFLYVKNHWTPVSYNLIDQSFEEALLSGTSSDQIYLFDLDKVDLHRYRAVMFMNVYKLTAAQREFIRQKVARDGRTLIWNYLPGYTDGQRNSLEFVKEVTGFNVEAYHDTTKPTVEIATGGEYSFDGPITPMAVIADPAATVLARLKENHEPIVARKTGNGFTSVYSTLPLHSTAFFRQIFKEAGCHVYNEANDFTYVNSGLLLVHTKVGGHRVLYLKNGKDVPLVLPPYSTWLLDANTGDVLLK
ncbi:MAG: hypothetical protein ABI273_04755 [Lacunisphaera sp.]